MPRERRRNFSVEQKLLIVEETRAPGATVPEVARRHDVSANLLYVWRRMAEGRPARPIHERARRGLAPVRLVPVKIEGSTKRGRASGDAAERPAFAKAWEGRPVGRSLGEGRIEIELPGGACVKVEGEVAPEQLATVLALLRG